MIMDSCLIILIKTKEGSAGLVLVLSEEKIEESD